MLSRGAITEALSEGVRLTPVCVSACGHREPLGHSTTTPFAPRVARAGFLTRLQRPVAQHHLPRGLDYTLLPRERSRAVEQRREGKKMSASKCVHIGHGRMLMPAHEGRVLPILAMTRNDVCRCHNK